MQKQIRFQEEEEKDVLEKIKMKMDRIKATHNKKQDGAQKATTDNHFDGKETLGLDFFYYVTCDNTSLNMELMCTMGKYAYLCCFTAAYGELQFLKCPLCLNDYKCEFLLGEFPLGPSLLGQFLLGVSNITI